ncbi:MAG: TraR/DksA family transcriptional regulator [Paracoccaceae bacterium]
MTDTKARKLALVSRKQFLTERLSSIERELEGHKAKDFAEMATEREGDEVLEDLGLASQEELRAIEAALVRIEQGEYGYCVRCGDEIDAERLDLIPQTPFCAPCAAHH